MSTRAPRRSGLGEAGITALLYSIYISARSSARVVGAARWMLPG
jgi:hypothetical protein